jgi:hypothetical protein
MSRPRKPIEAARFQIGARVRVKHGVRDPDFPDIPLGGWTGTVKEVEHAKGEVTYFIAWDRATLQGMHPIFRKRCDRDGLDFESMSLGEEDLEPDDGTSVPIEQPTEIKTPPLSEKDRDDRVRMAFGLTHDDPIPLVSPETLLTYYRYLSVHLKFPFFSFVWEKTGSFTRKKLMVPISRLDPPVEDEFDEEAGLYGIGGHHDEEIEFPLEVIELKKQDPNYQLLSDYTYWSEHWR